MYKVVNKNLHRLW